ncbi:MAG TPA: 50S ribosomal protein L35 [Thermotogota bacterium]|nr:50S ribosomal protein L35 [Thermotogota bacterium]HRW92561.1 50S ribosomal protein L35 [Thermotogota bacterium]
MAKNKMKTRKSAAKRFKLNRTGKVMRNHGCHAHETGKKSTKVTRRLRVKGVVPKAMEKKVKRMLAKV